MNAQNLNDLIHLIKKLKSYMDQFGSDPRLSNRLIHYTNQINQKYGEYLNGIIADLYDDLFEDDHQLPLLEYIWREVTVSGDEFFKDTLLMSIQANPLRIELKNLDGQLEEVIWRSEHVIQAEAA